MEQDYSSQEMVALIIKSLHDYPDLEDYERDAVLIAAYLYDPDSDINDWGMVKMYDPRSFPIVREILSALQTNEEVTPSWLAIVRYSVRLVQASEKGINDAVNFYRYNIDSILPRRTRQISDELLSNTSDFILSIACEDGEATISDLEQYFDLRHYKIVLPDWFDSPSMSEEYIKTQWFLIQFNRTFWNCVENYINGKRIIT